MRFFVTLIALIIIISGCQTLDPTTKSVLFPTPFLETLEAAEAYPPLTNNPVPTLNLPTNSPIVIEIKPTGTYDITDQIFPKETPVFQSSHLELERKIDQIISDSGGRWHIVIKEINGPTYYSLLAEQRIQIASVVKIPMALLFFVALEEKGISEYQIMEHINSTGTGGRTFEQLISAMLVKSEEDSFDIIAAYVSNYVNVPAQLNAWELQDIDLVARRFTVKGIATMYERLYFGEFVSPTARNLILGYLKEYTPNDETRIGILRNYIPEEYQIYNKRGSLLTPYVVADTAILENPDGKDFIIAMFAYNSEKGTTYEILDQAIADIAIAFWEYMSAE